MTQTGAPHGKKKTHRIKKAIKGKSQCIEKKTLKININLYSDKEHISTMKQVQDMSFFKKEFSENKKELLDIKNIIAKILN